MIKFPVFGILLLIGVFSLAAGPLEDGLDLEKRTDLPGAFKAYKEFLQKNPAAGNFGEVLLHAADINPDLNESISFLSSQLPNLKDPDIRSRAQAKIASLYELTGRYAEAQKTYSQAYWENPGESTYNFLYGSAAMSIEMGEFSQAEEHVRIVANLSKNPVLKKKAIFLLARVFASTGREKEALRIGKLLCEDPTNTEGNEKILLFLYRLALAEKRENEAELFLSRLEKEYGSSPEFKGTSEGSRVHAFPSPSSLLTAPVPSSAQKSLSAGPTASPVKTPGQDLKTSATGIQTGSFSVKENADYFAKDLEALGFPAIVREAKASDGIHIFKVIIPLPPNETNTEGSQRLMIRLKEKGIEGFLFFGD